MPNSTNNYLDKEGLSTLSSLIKGALIAKQDKITGVKGYILALSDNGNVITIDPSTLGGGGGTTGGITEAQLNSKLSGYALISHTHNEYVPTTRTVNGKSLTGNINLVASDVGAATSSHSHTEYASSSHTHSNYASSSHTHSEYVLGTAINNASSTSSPGTSYYIPVANGSTVYKCTINNLKSIIGGSSDGDWAPKANPVFIGSISMGRKSGTTTGTSSIAVGTNNEASGSDSCALGNGSVSSSSRSFSCGLSAISSGSNSIAMGQGPKASGNDSVSIGYCTEATKSNSIAMGSVAKASNDYACAIGMSPVASGYASFAIGRSTEASGSHSHAQNCSTIAAAMDQTAIGKYNISSSSESDKFIIGKGTSTARSNCFRVTHTGVYASGAHNSSGADYAEYFEWNEIPSIYDGNKSSLLGRFVTLNEDKVQLANSDTQFILGITSGNPSVVGDVYDDQWQGMYLYDIYGQPIWEDVEVEELDENGNTIMPKHIEHRQKLNPEYNNKENYIPRSERPEWITVGMLGKLVMKDDGTCIPNSYCKPSTDGIATHSDEETRFRVMKRIDENHIKVLIL